MIQPGRRIIRKRSGTLQRALRSYVARNARPGAEQAPRRALLVHAVDGLVLEEPGERVGPGPRALELLVN